MWMAVTCLQAATTLTITIENAKIQIIICLQIK